MLILISDAFDSELPKRLSRFGDVTTDKNRAPEAEVVLVRSKTKVNRAYIDAAPRLRLVIRGGVGLDNVDCEHAETRGITVHNTAEASTIAVAELAFAMMLALPNHLVRADTSMRQGLWIKNELERSELYGKRLAILGYGRIGSAVAARARAFDMRVVGWHPTQTFSDGVELVARLEDALEDADFVSLHVPLLDDTRGLVDARMLARFKRGAYLINTARGEEVREDDVVAALESGQLGGYATDVWYNDPPGSSPLLNAPNTILAPHIGASTRENMQRIGAMVERLIERFVAGS